MWCAVLSALLRDRIRYITRSVRELCPSPFLPRNHRFLRELDRDVGVADVTPL